MSARPNDVGDHVNDQLTDFRRRRRACADDRNERPQELRLKVKVLQLSLP